MEHQAGIARTYRQHGNNTYGKANWCTSVDEPNAPPMPLLSALNRSLGVFSSRCLIEFGLRHAGGVLPALLQDTDGLLHTSHVKDYPSILAGLVSYNTLELKWLERKPLVIVAKYESFEAEKLAYKTFR